MPNPVEKLNEIAHGRFEELKRQQLAKSRELPKKKQSKAESLTEEKFANMQNSHKDILTDIADASLTIFEKIDALNLPSNLSLAVSFIVIANEKPETKIENLQKVIQILEAEL